ncbi:MAG: LytTR family DNA-binding domain-containing protein [Ignavibacterium album]|jgi:DNA-binding LytR/AlgR family response regulator|uniref:LytR/AlgR family response regulator transcription factor n=1 Tax=Ignavibacterium album TaxID=591197 RepID=UPI0026F2591A|nr:LytTR family DNA-binding domain-containing protein [Ignavibacterium album]MCX8105942.1 LytTR family DNA-binding domain-containing protein [Ignavibacterium album]
MKTIIIEDEKLAAERLEELINEIDPLIEISAKLTSVEQSIKYLKQNKPDLIFLDIQLEDGLSFSIFEKIIVDVPVIFTTAYDQYAIKAFKLNSIDYLLKPIKKDELREALNKYKNIKSSYLMDLEEIIKSIQNKEVNYKKRFLIQYGQKIKKVEIDDVAYFYALEKNVFLTTSSGSTFPIDFTLDKLQEVIDPEKFFRINRKMIVSFNSIKNMIPYSRSRIKIELNPPESKEVEALVSVERSSAFKEWMDK